MAKTWRAPIPLRPVGCWSGRRDAIVRGGMLLGELEPLPATLGAAAEIGVCWWSPVEIPYDALRDYCLGRHEIRP